MFLYGGRVLKKAPFVIGHLSLAGDESSTNDKGLMIDAASG
jgi:hypothetical protein